MKEYIAQVVSVEDPEKYQRVQVRVFEKFPRSRISDRDLPWATYRLPAGTGMNEGFFLPAVKGEYVWVDFPFTDINDEEDTTRPRITGAVHYCPEGIPNLPHDSFEGKNSYYKSTAPPSEFGYSETKQSEPGKTAAFTKQGWSFRLHQGSLTATHLKTGSRLEFTGEGHFDIAASTTGFVRSAENLKFSADKASILMNSEEVSMELKSAGKFRMQNSTGSLKKVLEEILKHQKQTLSFLNDFLTEYASHMHISPGFGAPTPPPITVPKAVGINARVALHSSKVALTESRLKSLLK